MNIQKPVVAAFAVIALAATATANASEEKKITAKQVPQTVHEAFKKAYPAAQAVTYEEESTDGKPAFEVKFKEQGKEREALYGADGTLLETEEAIKVSELPEAVVKAVTKAHPHAKIKEAEKTLQPDGTVRGYEVEIAAGKKHLELELDANGVILETEKGAS